MKTNKLLSSFVHMGTRLIIFAALLVALIGTATDVAAAPSLALSTVSVVYASGGLTYASAGSVTYNVTVTRTASTPNSFTPSISSVLPAGVSGAFTPSGSVSFLGNPSRTITLVLSKTAALGASAGSYTFNVQASGTGVDPISPEHP